MANPPSLALPHTAGCFACGRDNPFGIHLNLTVSPETGMIRVSFTPTAHHIGFEGIAHGGVLATVFDEAMVWAASWHGKRFCVCGELTVRFRRVAAIGRRLMVEAQVTIHRTRLIQTTSTMRDATGNLVAESSAKYVPMPPDRHAAMIATFVADPATNEAAQALRTSF